MTNNTIDLRKLKNALKGIVTPENELPPPPEELLLQTEEKAHPEGFGDGAIAGRALIEWEAPDFEHNQSGSMLLLIFGALLGAGAIGVLFFKNFLFAIFLLVAGGLVISHAVRMPRQIKFSVTSRGIRIGSRLYAFEDLQSFWIFYDPPLFKELILRSKKTFMPVIRAPLGELDPVRLRHILLRFLREEEEEMSSVDIIAKRLGF